MSFAHSVGVDAHGSIFNDVHTGGVQINVTNNTSARQHAVFARFDSQDRQPCLEGTRTEILDDVGSWIEGRGSRTSYRIYWMNGLAGTGKTTIAYTIARRHFGILGASFFCSRDDADCSNPKYIFTTIADQLGQFYAPFQQQLILAYSADVALKYSSISSQLEGLLVNPLRAVRDNFPPCLIILDALDECKDDNTTSVILSALSRHIEQLAPLKFLVTSRPEQIISRGFRLPGLRSVTQSFNLHDVKLDIVKHDIENYLTTRFNEIREQWDFDSGWPTIDDIRSLASLSSGLFIFAATAVKFVEDPNYSDPKGQLARLLKTTVLERSSPHRHLDRLYTQVLTDAFPDISPHLSKRLTTVLGTISLLQYPLLAVDIEHLLKLEAGAVRSTTMHLGSVLIVPKGIHQLIRLIHPSFFDFLSSPTRCSNLRFAVDPRKLHALLAVACLGAMKILKRDICDIGDPSKLNSEVEDLSERIARRIPPYLQYACSNWAYHLSQCRVADIPLDLLEGFCYKFLLRWVEVCSLLGGLRAALVGLNSVCQLVLKIKTDVSDVVGLLRDCQRFIREFFPVLSISSSHTYHSALPFTPRETALRKVYSHELKQSVKVHCSVGKHWDPCLRTIEGHDHAVTSVAVSPDGAYVLSGSYDTTVRLWDFVTGAHHQLFQATEPAPVLSVAFSPSGAHIAAGLTNNLIRLWDVASGQHVLDLTGHTEKVSSVVFAPDGIHVASGSYDGPVRIWNATTGTNVGVTKGHPVGITSVAYSPSGAHIVSGSNDNTFRIQRTNDGHLRTFSGHSRAVSSIAFSSDDTKIFSGSYDGTIRTWGIAGVHLKTLDAKTSVAAENPPDYSEIISGTRDVWVSAYSYEHREAEYANTISSIAYSPNGECIASGLGGSTIQVWSTTGIRLNTLNGHSNAVLAVTYTPDGTQIVSGSYDGTVRIWDATNTSDTYGEYSGLAKSLGLVAVSLSRIATGSEVDMPGGQRRVQSYRKIALWNINGKHISMLRGPGDPRCVRLLFSQDATHLAAICDNDTIVLFSGEDGHYLRSIEGDINYRRTVDFSIDGAYIVSRYPEQTIRLWSVATGSQVASFRHTLESLHTIQFADDQKVLFAMSSYISEWQSFELPRELWLKREVNDMALLQFETISEDGWLYYSGPDRRRACWIPARLRPDHKSWIQNGCLLSMSRSHDLLCVTVT